MRAAVIGMVLCGLALISGSDRSFGQQPKQPRTLENLLEEPAEKAPPAPPAQEPVASVDLLAVPSEAEVAEAVILIREAYADGYKGEPGVLMKTLKSAAGQTDDAVRKFALLQEGEKLLSGPAIRHRHLSFSRSGGVCSRSMFSRVQLR